MGRFAQKLLSLAARPFEFDGRTLEVTSSIGVATFPEDGQDAETLLRSADAAMDRAKELGSNNFQLCTPELTAMAFERLDLQNGLRLALDRRSSSLHYQPLVSLHTREDRGPRGARPLAASGARAGHARRPSSRRPRKPASSCRSANGSSPPPAGSSRSGTRRGCGLRMAVNFSARQFRERGLVQTVEKAVSEAGLEPRNLEIEITESIAMEGAEIVVTNLTCCAAWASGSRSTTSARATRR